MITFEDGTLAKPSDKQNGFPTMDVLMYREYKYLTDPQYSLQLGLKYAFVLPGTKMKTYTAFDFTHRPYQRRQRLSHRKELFNGQTDYWLHLLTVLLLVRTSGAKRSHKWC